MYHFIVNPNSRSGYGKHIWKMIEHELKKENVIYQRHITHYEYHATKIIKQLLMADEGLTYIIVVGGDGTMNEVINAIPSYENVVIGYIPTGSSNDLALGLHIPNDPIKALHHILKATHFPSYDQGVVLLPGKKSPRKFAISCGFGFDAAICKEALDSKLKYFLNHFGLGRLTYAAIAFKQLFKTKLFDATLTIDGAKKVQLHNVYFIAGMNHKYEGGGLMIAPDANPTDKKLSVCAFHDIPKFMVFLYVPCILLGVHTKLKGVTTFNCKTLDIETKDAQIIHTDGEFAGRSKKLSMRCANEKLRMLK